MSQTPPPRSEHAAKVVAPAGPSSVEETRAVTLRGNKFDSRDIFHQSVREIIIAHGEDTYRLRLTSQNKLILTK